MSFFLLVVDHYLLFNADSFFLLEKVLFLLLWCVIAKILGLYVY